MSPTRERLLDTIRSRPGVNKSTLCATLGLAWGTVDYHLRALSRAGHVAVRPEGRETRCFPGGLQPNETALLSALADGCGSRIAVLLRHCPGQGVGELSERLGVSSKAVRRRLVRMVEDGTLERVGTHRPRYSLGSGAHGLFLELADRLRVKGGEAGEAAGARPLEPGVGLAEAAASKTGK